MAERGRGRPSADPADLREQVVTTKLNKPEGKSWGKLLDAMAAAGPKPRDADAVRWLMKEECLRRGIPWAEDDAEQPPAELRAQRVADYDASEAAAPAPAGKAKRPRR